MAYPKLSSTDTGRRVLRSAAITALLPLGGCVAFVPDKIHYEWDAGATEPCTDCAPESDRMPFVGLAFSGGGSRAATFAAAGAEALHERGWLAQVTHISSVSGGSLAAAHLVAHPLSDCGTADCEADYFREFRTAMRENYVYSTAFRELYKPVRFLSPTRRVLSLAEEFDDVFLDERTFGDIPNAPAIFINAARYDDARRFVFSNRVLPEPAEAQPAGSETTLQASSFSLAGCPRATPDDFPLSLAVATSSAFPPILGPVSIAVEPACGHGETLYWHLGDGGILENTGLETLHELLAREAAAPAPPERAVLISFDAGQQAIPEDMKRAEDLRLWTSNPGRVVGIANLRAESYRKLAWERMRETLGIPVTEITFRYTDAPLEEWPDACDRSDRRAETIAGHLSQIPTSFRITDCDADLMEAAARALVDAYFAAPEAGLPRQSHLSILPTER